MPLTYPHMLAFGLHMAIMTDASFPFPAIGTVHLENAITRHRPIAAGERLQVTCRPADLRPHPKGRVFDMVTTAHSAGELVWEERSRFLRLGKGDASASAEAPSRRCPPDPSAGGCPATWAGATPRCRATTTRSISTG